MCAISRAIMGGQGHGGFMTQVDHDIIQAYLETDYHVYGDCPFTLNIGKACAELSALHKTYHSSGSAFITAENPFSRPLDPVLNWERHISLARELAARGFPFIDGTGKHPSNLWPGEASFLVFGLTLEEARDLGRHYGQNAIVWNGAGAVPELILLR